MWEELIFIFVFFTANVKLIFGIIIGSVGVINAALSIIYFVYFTSRL